MYLRQFHLMGGLASPQTHQALGQNYKNTIESTGPPPPPSPIVYSYKFTDSQLVSCLPLSSRSQPSWGCGDRGLGSKSSEKSRNWSWRGSGPCSSRCRSRRLGWSRSCMSRCRSWTQGRSRSCRGWPLVWQLWWRIRRRCGWSRLWWCRRPRWLRVGGCSRGRRRGMRGRRMSGRRRRRRRGNRSWPKICPDPPSSKVEPFFLPVETFFPHPYLLPPSPYCDGGLPLLLHTI